MLWYQPLRNQTVLSDGSMIDKFMIYNYNNVKIKRQQTKPKTPQWKKRKG